MGASEHDIEIHAVKGVAQAVVTAIKAYVDERLAAIPAPRDGKDADIGAIKTLITATVSEAVASLPPARDGKDADVEALKAELAEQMNQAIAAIPVPRDGKDADGEIAIKAAKQHIDAAVAQYAEGVDALVETFVIGLIDKSSAASVASSGLSLRAAAEIQSHAEQIAAADAVRSARLQDTTEQVGKLLQTVVCGQEKLIKTLRQPVVPKFDSKGRLTHAERMEPGN
jgi:hypothetical protein